MNDNRPFVLNVEDAKNELVQSVNNIMQKYNVPCYFLEPILFDIANQMRIEARNEVARARQQVDKHAIQQ